jgi:hypothetical protein
MEELHMKGRQLTVKEILKLEVGTPVYLEIMDTRYKDDIGKAFIKEDDEDDIYILPLNGLGENDGWFVTVNGEASSFEKYFKVYEWVEENQKTKESNDEIKIGDYVYFISGKRYSICKIHNTEQMRFGEDNIVWGYWSREDVEELPKTLKDFNDIEKDDFETWMSIYDVKKLNLIGDTKQGNINKAKNKSTKQFTKSDLKTGMWVELRNGEKSLVFLNTKHGDIFSSNDTWGSLGGYSEDLTLKDEEIDDIQYDIVKVYQPTCNRDYYNFDSHSKVVWERKEEKPKNKIDKEVITNITYNNEPITLVHKDNWTTVRLKDGTMSKSRCHPEDIFDREKGLELAYYRAKKKQLDNVIDRLISKGL